MKIPHKFAEGVTVDDLFGVPYVSCQVCLMAQDHFYHRQPEAPNALLGELFDFVVDNVSFGKIPEPPNGLLSRCSKVLAR